MAEKPCAKRLQKDLRDLCKQPVPNIVAQPLPDDILEWHYVLEGSEGTPFAGGYYHGKIKFHPEYPYEPPAISMITPNGRFMTQKKICLSMSDFHPESWNPMWSVSTILNGLLSFMMENRPTAGGVNTTDAEKQRLAKSSLAFNCKNRTFRNLFPEYVEKYYKKLAEAEVSSAPTQEEDSMLARSKNSDNKKQQESMKRVEAAQRNKGQSFPTWLLLLIFSLFGLVMALPLIQA